MGTRRWIVGCAAACACSGSTTVGSAPQDAGIAADAGPQADAEAAEADASDAGPAGPTDCADPIAPPPASLGLSSFYKKYVDASGVPVVSSGVTTDLAVRRACGIVRHLVSYRSDVLAQMIAHHARVAVMARTEVTTDIPEHSDLNTAFPGTDWNVRARGLGGTVERPVTSCAEENILCDPADRYVGENILVHEFAHGMMNLGVDFAEPAYRPRAKSAYTAAIAKGLWANTYAGSNDDEYYAEGVQSWFDTNIEKDPPDGIHNAVNTRKELAAYDPSLAGLIAEVFPPANWTPGCP